MYIYMYVLQKLYLPKQLITVKKYQMVLNHTNIQNMVLWKNVNELHSVKYYCSQNNLTCSLSLQTIIPNIIAPQSNVPPITLLFPIAQVVHFPTFLQSHIPFPIVHTQPAFFPNTYNFYYSRSAIFT